MQDAVEAFLRIVAEHSRVRVTNSESLGGLMNKVGEHHPGVLGHAAPIDRLNRARVGFKHHGISVSHEDSVNFYGNVRAFLTEISDEVFGVDFWSISLVDVVEHRRTQNWLRKAETHVRNGEIRESLICSGKAAALFLRYRASFGGLDGEMSSISVGGGPKKWPHRFFWGIGESDREFMEWAGQSLKHIRASMSLMERGVDMVAFNRFRSLMPHVALTNAGTFYITEIGSTHRHTMSATEQDALFCINFVVELAIRLQETASPAAETTHNASSTYTVLIVRPCDVIVYPEQEPQEVIRRAAQGERLQARSHPDDESEYVTIIEDRDRAYVPKDCVEVIEAEFDSH